MASIPNEQKALERDAARKPQMERERADFGLQPGTANDEVPGIGGLSSEDEEEPESVFASQFAGIAAIMEGILAKKKSNQASKSSELDRGLPGIRQDSEQSNTGFWTAGQGSGFEKSRWNTSGYGPVLTSDPSEETNLRAYAPSPTCVATPCAQDQPPQHTLQRQPLSTKVNGESHGTKPSNVEGGILPSGQSWW